MNLHQTALKHVKSGMKVLDLGCGAGKFAVDAANLGAVVTAIDKTANDSWKDDRVMWTANDAKDFIEHMGQKSRVTMTFDLIYCRNVIQFMPKAWVLDTLLPALQAMLNPGGIILIETFFDQPKPPFNRPVPSLYALHEVMTALPGSDGEKGWLDAADMAGNPREFALVQVVKLTELRHCDICWESIDPQTGACSCVCHNTVKQP